MTTPARADRIDDAVLLFEALVHYPSSALGTLLDAARSLSRLLRSDVMKIYTADSFETISHDDLVRNSLSAEVLEIIGGVGL